jgi:hypothetical protein
LGISVPGFGPRENGGKRDVKYEPLRQWLKSESSRGEITMSFADVERLIGAVLPSSAFRHQAWWANDATHVQAEAWMSAGWLVDAVDQRARRVRFRHG